MKYIASCDAWCPTDGYGRMAAPQEMVGQRYGLSWLGLDN